MRVARPANIIEVWTHGGCAGGGYGGWSYVIREGDEWRGVAGGATRTDAEAMALTGLLAALDTLAAAPKGARFELHFVDPMLLAGSELHLELSRRLDKIGEDRPGKLKIVPARKSANADDWASFLSSWAEFARDKAKARGAFSAPIPKLNIAKFVQDAI